MTTSNSIKYCANNSAISNLNPGELAYDSSTGSLFVGASNSSNSAYNVCVGTSSNSSYNTIASLSDYVTNSWYNDTDCYSDLFDCLTESEISDLMSKAQTRLSDATFKRLIKQIVLSYHFSEEFLLEYAEFIDKDVVMRQHKKDIISGEYQALKCLYELQ